MIAYRLCFINPKTRRIDRERQIDASDDIDAIHAARASDHRPLELWCGDRRIGTFAEGDLALHA